MTIKHNFSQFMQSMRQAWSERDHNNAAGVRKVAIQAFADVQVGSPVDQGRFKGSHFLSMDSPEFQPLPDGHDPSQNATEAAGRLNGAEQTLEGMQKIPANGVSIFITNNLPYANALEHGHSQQAPQGVYGIAEQRARRNIERLAKETS